MGVWGGEGKIWSGVQVIVMGYGWGGGLHPQQLLTTAIEEPRSTKGMVPICMQQNMIPIVTLTSHKTQKVSEYWKVRPKFTTITDSTIYAFLSLFVTS